MFESSVNSYDGQTTISDIVAPTKFESSVNSYDGQTRYFLSSSRRSV